MITRATSLYRTLQTIRYNFGQWSWEQMPKPWNLPNTRKEKKMLYSKQMNPFPKFIGKFNDTLHIDGLTGDRLLNLYEDFVESKQVPLSSQFVALLLYNFSKNNFLNEVTWAKIEPYISQNRGQYNMRSIFGALYGCIRHGHPQYTQFFIQQLEGQKVTFTDEQGLEIMEAFNLSKHPYQKQFKHHFWDTVFKPHFIKTIHSDVRIHNYKKALRVFDAFVQFDYLHDQQLFNIIIGWLDGRSGWKRTEIIQKLYPLTGTFPKAKEIFDKYYIQLSENKHAQWRYNFDELRLYSSEEMIAKSQDNIQMIPSDRTVFKRKHQKKIHDDYYQWLKDGARQKEAQLVKDKAQSLAYAIKNRYQSLRKDKVDFTQLSLEEFEDLFGTYDKDLMYKPPEVQQVQLDQNGNPINPPAENEDNLDVSGEQIKKMYAKKPEQLDDEFDLSTSKQKRDRIMQQRRKREPKERKPSKKWS